MQAIGRSAWRAARRKGAREIALAVGVAPFYAATLVKTALAVALIAGLGRLDEGESGSAR